MDIVHPTGVEPAFGGGFCIPFEVGEYGACLLEELELNTARCKSAIDELVGCLARSAPLEIRMPELPKGEIEVEGELLWNGDLFSVSFLTMDGIVFVAHRDRGCLERLYCEVESQLRVIPSINT